MFGDVAADGRESAQETMTLLGCRARCLALHLHRYALILGAGLLRGGARRRRAGGRDALRRTNMMGVSSWSAAGTE
jgi:hypothetical protein